LNSIVLTLGLFPFAAIGVYVLSTFIKRKIMVKKGYFLVKKHLKNGGVDVQWIKPTSAGIEFKGAESDNKSPLALDDSKDCVYNESGIPTIEYKSDGTQISYNSENRGGSINADELGNLSARMYNLGQLDRGKKNKILLLGAYAAMGALVVGVFTLLILFSYIQNSGAVGVIIG